VGIFPADDSPARDGPPVSASASSSALATRAMASLLARCSASVLFFSLVLLFLCYFCLFPLLVVVVVPLALALLLRLLLFLVWVVSAQFRLVFLVVFPIDRCFSFLAQRKTQKETPMFRCTTKQEGSWTNKVPLTHLASPPLLLCLWHRLQRGESEESSTGWNRIL
jgi:hypothetical protein